MTEEYGLQARLFALGASMLQDTDRATWKGRGCSEGDVLLAITLGQMLLRINSIELGLKHVIKSEMQKAPPKRHDLAQLWDLLTNEWRRKIAEVTDSTEDEIRTTLDDHKSASVHIRFGGNFGATSQQPETARRQAVVLERLANTLGGKAHPAV